MRLVTFSLHEGQAPRIGAAVDESIVDLAAAYAQYLQLHEDVDARSASRLAEALIPGDMTSFLEGGRLSRNAADRGLAVASDSSGGSDGFAFRAEEVRLLPPATKPPTIRDCMSFEEHVQNAYRALGRSVPREWYEIPVYYKGTPAALAGPDDDVLWPEPSEQLDFELEYAVVIGKRGKAIQHERAMEFVAGYLIFNDFSARDLQRREMAVGLGPAKGKDFDTGTVIGPCLVTSDEVDDPYVLRMVARVNDEVICEGNSGSAYWKWADIISHISQNETLLPGDIIASGTVGRGCLLEHDRGFLAPGDVVELEVERLGLLRSTVRRSGLRSRE
jgi:2-keto-4-pentenoate hydratase/2-oxohepta-3-ene-1,7-dioic acid hydratase in catechol pathway